MNELLNFNATELLATICVMVVSWVLARAGKALDARAKAEAGKNNMQAAKTAYETLANICDDVVQFMNSKMVNDLKAAASDGKLTKEEGEAIFKEAYNHVASTLSSDIKTAIETNYGDLETLITRQIQVYVEKNKTSFLTAVATPLIGGCGETQDPDDVAADGETGTTPEETEGTDDATSVPDNGTTPIDPVQSASKESDSGITG